MSTQVDGEVIDTTAVEVYHQPPPANMSLFGTDDPVEVVEKASRVASALKDVIVQRELYSNIQGREHVRVEGWQLCGSMLGVTAVCVHTEQVDGGWKATVEARRVNDGTVIGRADALCTKAERTWKSRDDYALLSMAQTRATSKALRGPLGFVVALAGYETTPAEEMPPDGHATQVENAIAATRAIAASPPQVKAAPPQQSEPTISSKQRGLLHARCAELGLDDDTRHALTLCVTGQPHSDRIPVRLFGEGGEKRRGILGVLAVAKDKGVKPADLLAMMREAYKLNGGPLDGKTDTLITTIEAF